MGDAGSIPLGFLAGALGVQGALAGAWPFWFPVLVFSPFIVDATVTLARRMVRREPFWRAHRAHYYQRLVLSGWSHRRVALGAYALMCAGAAAALAGVDARFFAAMRYHRGLGGGMAVAGPGGRAPPAARGQRSVGSPRAVDWINNKKAETA